MVEQSKKVLRQKRQARRAARAARAAEGTQANVMADVEAPAPVKDDAPQATGFLGLSGRSADDIAQEDRALRAAFPQWDGDEMQDAASDTTEMDAPHSHNDEALPDEPAAEPLLLTPAVAAVPFDHIPSPDSVTTAPDEQDYPTEPEMDEWPLLGTMPVQRQHLGRNLVITASRRNPVHAAFDVLRARLVQALSENGWKRVGITSPTRDCGKTFVAVNLAVALSRYENCRTLLMDMDMRNPSVSKILSLRDVGSMGDYLRGQIATRDQFFKFDRNDLKIGENLAVAMNEQPEPFASELLQQPETRDRLNQMEEELHPDVVLFDLPPALANDDVIAFKGRFDGVLIVIDGTRSSAAEVREVMRRLGDDVPLLGVVLNKAEDASGDEYRY